MLFYLVSSSLYPFGAVLFSAWFFMAVWCCSILCLVLYGGLVMFYSVHGSLWRFGAVLFSA